MMRQSQQILTFSTSDNVYLMPWGVNLSATVTYNARTPWGCGDTGLALTTAL
jgi:hypothetical protein